jgi:hypothetical protein
MRRFTNIIAALLLALPVAAHAQSEKTPACRAHLDGQQLTTTIEFSGGYTVEGPWHVLKNQPVAMSDGQQGLVLGAVLTELVEIDATSGSHTSTSLPRPIAVQFSAHSQEELVSKAATVFCFSVVKARSESSGLGSEVYSLNATATR